MMDPIIIIVIIITLLYLVYTIDDYNIIINTKGNSHEWKVVLFNRSSTRSVKTYNLTFVIKVITIYFNVKSPKMWIILC